ncbi:hypothetical protein HK104_007584 [Borealophlyctis nickersoniae]|nr:hypothetical protein HK104_007584 [Borealophlyctis nickersoniae]
MRNPVDILLKRRCDEFRKSQSRMELRAQAAQAAEMHPERVGSGAVEGFWDASSRRPARSGRTGERGQDEGSGASSTSSPRSNSPLWRVSEGEKPRRGASESHRRASLRDDCSVLAASSPTPARPYVLRTKSQASSVAVPNVLTDLIGDDHENPTIERDDAGRVADGGRSKTTANHTARRKPTRTRYFLSDRLDLDSIIDGRDGVRTRQSTKRPSEDGVSVVTVEPKVGMQRALSLQDDSAPRTKRSRDCQNSDEVKEPYFHRPLKQRNTDGGSPFSTTVASRKQQQPCSASTSATNEQPVKLLKKPHSAQEVGMTTRLKERLGQRMTRSKAGALGLGGKGKK